MTSNQYEIRESVVNIIQEATFEDGTPYQPKTSVCRVRQPIHGFTATNKYNCILNIAKDTNTLILHCYGVPGNGKSETLRKVAQQFPFENSPLFVKWHIQCRDSGHDVKTEVKELVSAMCRNGILNNDEYQNIVNSVDCDTASHLIECLKSKHIPVLIIMEDLDWNGKSKEFIRDILRSIKTIEDICRFHIYIASRKKIAALSEDEISASSVYKLFKIEGFGEEEGLKFLLDGVKQINNDKEAARQIYHRFSGSPLGLRAAKSFCKKSKINYDEYLDLLTTDSSHILEQEIAVLKEEYGEQFIHVFDAITMPFKKLFDNEEVEDRLQWKVLCCLSYMNYDRVPRFLITECFQKLNQARNETISLSNVKSGKLITQLSDHAMCSVTDEEDITFHEVVTHAFRHQSKASSIEGFDPLQSAILVLAGIVTKDLNEKKNKRKMFKLARHAEELMQHVEKNKSILKLGADWDLLRLIICYLYETFGKVMLSISPSYYSLAIEYFVKALELVWEDEDVDLWSKQSGQEARIAQYAVDQYLMTPASPGFAHNFASKLQLYLSEPILKFLKQESTDDRKFQKVKDEISKKLGGTSNKVIINLLKDCGLFLDEVYYQKIIFPEQIASILHSRSQVVLYKETPPTDEELEDSKWFSSLAYAIALECKERFGVQLLIEHLAIKGGSIPILLMKKHDYNALIEVKKMCCKVLEKTMKLARMYENGLLKEVFGTSDITELQTLRNLVRLHSRLLGHKFFVSISQDELVNLQNDGDQFCTQLYDLAERFLNKSNACMSYVYCGKFYAVTGKFDKAIECFKKFFAVEEQQTHNVKSWACYNFARTVLCGKLEFEFEEAITRSQKALNSNEVIGRQLNADLKDVLKKLTHINSQ
ncbi:uncharacterized protein LOC143461915 [Clavelina lepadiformis]|uniref:uncharacterized protein LOC143461915 n=1 Tax=Clavelina lepadiformis TaxID=159417 RepID=UPI00404243F1